MTRATRASRPGTGSSGRAASRSPRPVTSRQVRVSVPAWGSIAEWNFSAPARDCHHWKNRTPSAPRATDCMLSAAICPGAFGAFVGRQLRAFVACSMSSQPVPGFSDRMRSRCMAASRKLSGSFGSG